MKSSKTFLHSLDNLIDLRSDTVTRPSPAMRKAMAEAVVGDDVYGEDPTVNQLEGRAAQIFGKEAALFVPTGTMGNTIALKLLTNHGEEVLCESKAHILDWELSMLAWFAGCLVRSVETADGVLTWERVEQSLRKFGPNNAPTTAIALENTHNMRGGTVYALDTIDEICHEAHKRALKVHIDGARIFNAATALNVPVARIARDTDTVMFCLSKGLGAPVGSMVVGNAEAMTRGRLLRKRLGGGMRQAGVLAAAGLVALEESPVLLAEDHRNAQILARGLAAIPGVAIDGGRVTTNIVIFDVAGLGMSGAVFSQQLKEHGVLASEVGPTLIRMVTHRDVSREECERAVNMVAYLANAGAQATAAV